MSPLWVVAEVCFYAKDEAEADALHERMIDLACRGEIGMGLHVCQRTFAGGMRWQEVPEGDFREACRRDPMPWREWFRRLVRRPA